jgi:nucleoside 2-deoxyribosyltransferase
MKTPEKRLRCFVAMAFDCDDTDRIYLVFERLLRSMGITAVRVDRIEHNDDIDNRIIQEIEQADFVLADLTYARPSVYFEAGYAQRAIPVVYTCRRDHFRPRVDDPNGNVRVHFDLQMKNIVAWLTEHDSTFAERLRRRIAIVIKPLLVGKAAEAGWRKLLENFNQLSLEEKRGFLQNSFREHFASGGYRITEVKTLGKDAPDFLNPDLSRSFYGSMLATNYKDGVFHVVFLHIPNSITKDLFDRYRYGLIRMPIYGQKLFLSLKSIPSRIREDLIVCSFGSAGFRRAASYIPYMRPSDADQTLTCEQPFEIIRPSKGHPVRRDVTLHIFESTPRLIRFTSELNVRFPLRRRRTLKKDGAANIGRQ